MARYGRMGYRIGMIEPRWIFAAFWPFFFIYMVDKRE